MIVIIKSGSDTREAKRGVRVARDTTSDIVLLQNAVALAQPERLEGFCGTAFALDEDVKLRGIKSIDKGVKEINYGEMIDLMAQEDRVVGIF